MICVKAKLVDGEGERIRLKYFHTFSYHISDTCCTSGIIRAQNMRIDDEQKFLFPYPTTAYCAITLLFYTFIQEKQWNDMK